MKTINRSFRLDQRDARILDAMISNLESFLVDADRRSERCQSAIGVKTTNVVISISHPAQEADGEALFV